MAGPRTLCNACGLVYAKLVCGLICIIPASTLTPFFDRVQIKRRGREARVARDGPNSGAVAEIGDDALSGEDGGSDDDEDDDGDDPFSGEESHDA